MDGSSSAEWENVSDSDTLCAFRGLPIAIMAAIVPFLLTACDDRGAEAAQREQPATTSRGAAVCEVEEAGRPLPEEVRESSGLAGSRTRADLLWTHNDAGNDAELFAVDATGALVTRARVSGVEAVDWEDIGAGPCAGGSCLFIADVGDNEAERDHITVYRVPEPEPDVTEATGAVALTARFPDAPQDAEAFFVLPGGEAFLVTKGRHGPITLYRYPTTPGAGAALERVRELWPEPRSDRDRVTGATASPDGRWVGIRTLNDLYLYPAAALLGGSPAEPVVVDLSPLKEGQGESVTIGSDGTVWLSSEADNRNDRAVLSRMRCTFPGG